MKKTKENLLADYKRAREMVGSLPADSQDYKMWLEEEDKIRNELIKLIQIESENKRDLVRNIIQVGTFVASSILGVWAVLASFQFDKDSTLTSTNGRNIVTNFVSKTLTVKR